MPSLNETERLVLHDSLRRALRESRYEPLSGVGCLGVRTEVPTPVPGLPYAAVPSEMLNDGDYAMCADKPDAWRRLRCHYDFEYWAASCVVVKTKQGQEYVPFELNAPQRRVLAVLEADRLADRPIRLILLKARQWGGSTLVQMYMAWIQCVHRKNWHSVICAHVADSSANIRGMYTKMLENYPAEMWEGEEAPCFKPFEGRSNVRFIAGRGCRVTIGTSEKPDSVRGSDFAMAHLSETAYWQLTRTRSPRAVIQAVCGSVNLLPYTLVAIESTARGVGDFFHTEWLRGKEGRSDKHAVFVPWKEIPFYRLKCTDATCLLADMNPTERWLWAHGCDSEQLSWYRWRVREFGEDANLGSEYPVDDVEAFSNSANMVLSSAAVEELRKGCTAAALRGEVDRTGTRFIEDAKGRMSVWEGPRRGGRYVVAVDVGGRSATSDWSVIAVLDAVGERPRVVAQWRGHIDHDLLAEKSVAVARYYRHALLVIESNTFETDFYGGGGDSNLFVLNRIADSYDNLYRRETFDSVTSTYSTRVGFHTNRSTKTVLIGGLIAAVREGSYVERDNEACNEMLVYEQLPNGSYAAKKGHHDDILMTRAIALYVITAHKLSVPEEPAEYRQRPGW